MPGRRRNLAALIVGVFLARCAFSPPSAFPQSKRTKSDADISKIGHRKITTDVNFYSPENELKLGKQLAQEVERSSKVINDSMVIAYVNQLGQKIAQNSDARFPITVRVIDAETISAFTLPGGPQYIDKALILQTETEAELAGVLAYGIALTALRAGTRDASKGQVMQLATIPLILLGPGGWGGNTRLRQANFAIPLIYLKFQRNLVFDADYFGIQYLYKSGYDPESMPHFFERVWPSTLAGPKAAPETFSPYPPLQDRLKAMRTEIHGTLPHRDTSTVSTSEFENLKQHLRTWNLPNPKDADASKPILRKSTSNCGPDQR